jgi:hypothetical protein
MPIGRSVSAIVHLKDGHIRLQPYRPIGGGPWCHASSQPGPWSLTVPSADAAALIVLPARTSATARTRNSAGYGFGTVRASQRRPGNHYRHYAEPGAGQPSDATNYLGGIADVLEDKRQRGDLLHLGELAGIALYGNDRQLHDVRYRWELGQDVRYQVRIWQR